MLAERVYPGKVFKDYAILRDWSQQILEYEHPSTVTTSSDVLLSIARNEEKKDQMGSTRSKQEYLFTIRPTSNEIGKNFQGLGDHSSVK